MKLTSHFPTSPEKQKAATAAMDGIYFRKRLLCPRHPLYCSCFMSSPNASHCHVWSTHLLDGISATPSSMATHR